MAKPTDLTKIKYGYPIKPGVKPLKRPLKIIGFDSETNIRGSILVVAASDGSYAYGEPIDDVLAYLTKKEYQHSCNFFYNLGYDHNAVFRSVLGCDQLDELTFVGRTKVRGYSLESIRGKMLKITKNGHVWRYFDIANFYKGGGSGKLVNVYENTFGEPYTKRIDASKEILWVDDEIVQYCIEDAQACCRLAENFAIPANQLVPIDKFYSGASLAKRFLRKNLSRTYNFRPSELQQAALNAYGGARIEVFKRGGWGFNNNEKLYMYDIRSAYPSIQCELDDIVCKKISHKPEYEPESLHSFFKIDVRLDDTVVGLLKYKYNGVIFYPVGECAELWVDKNEIELLLDYDVRFNIVKAEHDMSRPEGKPYGYLKELYELRLKYKKSKNLEERQLDFILKIALASSYGILIERNAKTVLKDVFTEEEMSDPETLTMNINGKIRACVPDWKAGQFFNPVHACEVTSAIRCKLYRDSERHKEHLVKFATDSMTFDKRISLDFGDDLGQYEDSPAWQGIVVGCGVYSMVSEGRKLNRFRSFDSHDLIEMAIEHGDSPIVEIVKQSPMKLKESRLDRFIWFNTFQEKRKRLDINFDHRRVWEPPAVKDFKTLMADVYDSKPLDFQSLAKVGRIPKREPIIDDTIDVKALTDSSLTRIESQKEMRRLIQPTLKDYNPH